MNEQLLNEVVNSQTAGIPAVKADVLPKNIKPVETQPASQPVVPAPAPTPTPVVGGGEDKVVQSKPAQSTQSFQINEEIARPLYEQANSYARNIQGLKKDLDYNSFVSKYLSSPETASNYYKAVVGMSREIPIKVDLGGSQNFLKKLYVAPQAEEVANVTPQNNVATIKQQADKKIEEVTSKFGLKMAAEPENVQQTMGAVKDEGWAGKAREFATQQPEEKSVLPEVPKFLQAPAEGGGVDEMFKNRDAETQKKLDDISLKTYSEKIAKPLPEEDFAAMTKRDNLPNQGIFIPDYSQGWEKAAEDEKRWMADMAASTQYTEEDRAKYGGGKLYKLEQPDSDTPIFDWKQNLQPGASSTDYWVVAGDNYNSIPNAKVDAFQNWGRMRVPVTFEKVMDDYTKYLNTTNPEFAKTLIDIRGIQDEKRRLGYDMKDYSADKSGAAIILEDLKASAIKMGFLDGTAADENKQILKLAKEKNVFSEDFNANMVLGAFNHQKAIIIGEYNKGNITKENADKALATIEKTKLKTLEMNPKIKESLRKQEVARLDAEAYQEYADMTEKDFRARHPYLAGFYYDYGGLGFKEGAKSILNDFAQTVDMIAGGPSLMTQDMYKAAEAEVMPTSLQGDVFGPDGFSAAKLFNRTANTLTQMVGLVGGSGIVGKLGKFGKVASGIEKTAIGEYALTKYAPQIAKAEDATKMIVTAYSQSRDDFYESAKSALISAGYSNEVAEDMADSYANRSAAVMAGLETLVPIPFLNKIKTGIVDDFAALLNKGENGYMATAKAIGNSTKDLGIEIGKQFGEEFLQDAGDKANNAMFNKAAGMDLLDSDMTLKGIGELLMVTATSTLGMGVGTWNLYNGPLSKKATIFLATQDIDKFNETVDTYVKDGKLDKKEGASMKEGVKNVKYAMNGLPEGKKFSDRQKIDLGLLIYEKKKLDEEVKSGYVDELFKEEKEAEINKKKQKLNDEILKVYEKNDKRNRVLDKEKELKKQKKEADKFAAKELAKAKLNNLNPTEATDDTKKGKRRDVSAVNDVTGETGIIPKTGTQETEAGAVGVGGDVRLEEPSAEQQLKDVQQGNTVTFEYKNESEVPELFKDKISSKGEINGKPYVKVTMAKSLADYHLQEQSIKETPQAGSVDALKDVESTAKALEGKELYKIPHSVEQEVSLEEINKIPKGRLNRSEESQQSLVEDIKKNGIKEPIVLIYNVKENTLRVQEGHHRIDAANKLGINNIPIKIQVEWDKQHPSGIDKYNPKQPLNLVGYEKRNYQPSNIGIEEIGFTTTEKSISEAYHKAKKDGSNPELVQAVENLLGKPKTKTDDTKDKTGLPSEVGKGQESVKAQPIEKTGGETTTTGGDVQTPKKVDDAKIIKKIATLSKKLEALNRKYVKLDNSWNKEMTTDQEIELSFQLEKIQTEMSAIAPEIERLQSIKDQPKAEVKAPEKTIAEKTKTLADNIRKYKAVQSLNDMNKLKSDPLGLFKGAYDGIIETVAFTIEGGGKLAQSLSNAMASMKGSKWYNDLSAEGKKKADEMLPKKVQDIYREHNLNKRAEKKGQAKGETIGKITQAKADKKAADKQKKVTDKEAQKKAEQGYSQGAADGEVVGKIDQAKADKKAADKKEKETKKEIQKKTDQGYGQGLAEGTVGGEIAGTKKGIKIGTARGKKEGKEEQITKSIGATAKQRKQAKSEERKMSAEQKVLKEKTVKGKKKVFYGKDTSQKEKDNAIKRGNNFRGRIKTRAKNARKNKKTLGIAEIEVMESFAALDPELIFEMGGKEAIEQYNEMARQIINATASMSFEQGTTKLKPTERTLSNQEVKTFVEKMDKLYETYQFNVLKSKNKGLIEVAQSLKDSSTGKMLLGENFTFQELNAFLDKFNVGKRDVVETINDSMSPNKVKEMKMAVDGDLERLKEANEKGMFNGLDKNRKKVIDNIMKLSTENLTPDQLIRANYVINNIIANQRLDGAGHVEAVAISQQAVIKIKEIFDKYGVKGLRQFRNGLASAEFMTLPAIRNAMAKNQDLAAEIGEVLKQAELGKGYADVMEGINKNWSTKRENLKKTYGKDIVKNPENRIRQGMYAIIIQWQGKTDLDKQEWFEDNKRLLEEDIKYKKSSKDENIREEGKIEEKIFNKVFKNAETMEEASKAMNAYMGDKKMVELANNVFSENLDKFKFSSEVYGNQDFDEWNNYSHRKWKESNEDNKWVEFDDNLQNNKNMGLSVFDKNVNKKTAASSLDRTSIRPKKTKVLNLDFFTVQDKAIHDSYYQANTLGTRYAIKEIFENEEMVDAIGVKNMQILRQRTLEAINHQMGVTQLQQELYKGFNKVLNFFIRSKSAGALGGPGSLLKQSVGGLTGALIRNPRTGYKAFKYVFANPNSTLFSESNLRSRMGAIFEGNIESMNDLSDPLFKGYAKKFFNGIDELNKNTVEGKNLVGKVVGLKPLQYADYHAAKGAWMTYYEKKWKQNNKGKKFSWAEQESNPDKSASTYADHMIETTMNVNDVSNAGNYFRNNKSWNKIFRTMFSPFASFAVNQDYRTLNALRNITSLDLKGEKRLQGFAELSSVIGEQVAFNYTKMALSTAIGYMVANAIAAVGGDDEEARKKADKLYDELPFQKDGLIGLRKATANTLFDATPIGIIAPPIMGVAESLGKTYLNDYLTNSKYWKQIFGDDPAQIFPMKGYNMFGNDTNFDVPTKAAITLDAFGMLGETVHDIINSGQKVNVALFGYKDKDGNQVELTQSQKNRLYGLMINDLIGYGTGFRSQEWGRIVKGVDFNLQKEIKGNSKKKRSGSSSNGMGLGDMGLGNMGLGDMGLGNLGL